VDLWRPNSSPSRFCPTALGGFLSHFRYPNSSLDGLWKIHQWMNWGYHFRNPPCFIIYGGLHMEVYIPGGCRKSHFLILSPYKGFLLIPLTSNRVIAFPKMPRIPSGKQTNGPFIVDLPIKIGDFLQLCKRLPEGFFKHPPCGHPGPPKSKKISTRTTPLWCHYGVFSTRAGKTRTPQS